MTSVLIVEDQRMPRENMEHLVEDSGRYRRVASLSTAEMALAQCARHAVGAGADGCVHQGQPGRH